MTVKEFFFFFDLISDSLFFFISLFAESSGKAFLSYMYYFLLSIIDCRDFMISIDLICLYTYIDISARTATSVVVE